MTFETQQCTFWTYMSLVSETSGTVRGQNNLSHPYSCSRGVWLGHSHQMDSTLVYCNALLCQILYARNIWDDQDYYYYEKQHSVKENAVIMQPQPPFHIIKSVCSCLVWLITVEQHYNLYKIKLIIKFKKKKDGGGGGGGGLCIMCLLESVCPSVQVWSGQYHEPFELLIRLLQLNLVWWCSNMSRNVMPKMSGCYLQGAFIMKI